MRKKTILVLHATPSPARQVMIKHITALPRYCNDYKYVFHHINAPLTANLLTYPFDNVIINFCFLSFIKARTDKYRLRYQFLKKWRCCKIVIAQDDYTNNQILDNWIFSIGASVVYSPIEKNLEILYPKCIENESIEFRSALTGYTDSDDIKSYEDSKIPWDARKIDIGSRVRMLPAYYGKHGVLKGEITTNFAELAKKSGFVVDVSTNPKDVILSKNWLTFLANCKFSIGSKGGASLADPIGDIRKSVDSFMVTNPKAKFKEIEQACFPGQDMTYIYEAVSPRLFECAALDVCQILIGDNWPGGLKPKIDYINLAGDLSNVEEVFSLMRDDEACHRMALSCKKKLVESGFFDYSVLVNDINNSIEKYTKIEVSKSEARTKESLEDQLRKHFEILKPFEVLRKIRGGYFLHILLRNLDVNMRYGQLEACRFGLTKQIHKISGFSNKLIELDRGLTHPRFVSAFLELASFVQNKGCSETEAFNELVHGFSSGKYDSFAALNWNGCEIYN